MGLVNEGLNLIVCPLCKSPQAKASEQVQFIPPDRNPPPSLPQDCLDQGMSFILFLLMITE